jgi:predicted nucleotide-binding protein
MPYFHVRVTRKSDRSNDALELDLSEGELQERIVQRFLQGKAFMCGGQPIPPSDVEVIRINVTEEPSKVLLPKIKARLAKEQNESDWVIIGISDEWYVTKEGEDVTRVFIKHPPSEVEEKPKKLTKALSNNVFIVHGKDDASKLELARILEKIGFKAIILSEQADKGRTIIEKLEQETMDVGYAFVILTSDDVVLSGEFVQKLERLEEDAGIIVSKEEFWSALKKRARQNVVLELGYFVGKIGRNRVCCLYKGEVELPSDIHGVLFKKFDKSVEECFKGIVEELKAAGYEIKL